MGTIFWPQNQSVQFIVYLFTLGRENQHYAKSVCIQHILCFLCLSSRSTAVADVYCSLLLLRVLLLFIYFLHASINLNSIFRSVLFGLVCFTYSETKTTPNYSLSSHSVRNVLYLQTY